QAAEQHWQDSQIASYRLTVLEVHSVWFAQRMTFTVTDGHVVDVQSMCIPAPAQGPTCAILPVEPSDYLVPALLKRAHKMLEGERPEFVRLEFDPTLGYPTSMSFNDHQTPDGDYGLSIKDFERLPGKPTGELGESISLRVGETVQTDGLTITLSRI